MELWLTCELKYLFGLGAARWSRGYVVVTGDVGAVVANLWIGGRGVGPVDDRLIFAAEISHR